MTAGATGLPLTDPPRARVRAPGRRRARRDRADADPRRPLPRPRPRGDPRRGARRPLVTIGFDGHPDGPLDDVEVMLRGRLPAETFDRILARAPALRWVHSATAGVERVLTPASRDRGLVDHQRARRVLAADRRVRPADDPRRVAPPARSSWSSRPSARGSRSSRASCAT